MKALVLTSVLGIFAMISEIIGLKKILWYVVILGLIGILVATIGDWNLSDPFFYGMMSFDNYAVLFTALLLLLSLLWFFITKETYDAGEFNQADHYALILFSLVGGIVLSSYTNLAMLFLGIEILSIPMYILAGSNKKDLSSNEASLKYFMMGAFATGILLFGIALIYGATGSFSLHRIAAYAANHQDGLPTIFYTGMLLILIGLGFKVSAVPFHFWAPDVYQGAPTVITAFMATLVKTSAFAGFYRIFFNSMGTGNPHFYTTIAAISVVTILVGNILAISQTSVKRMLAYSGIAQAGYMLLTLLVMNQQSTIALLFYLGSYSVATLAAFAVLNTVSRARGSEDFEAFNSLGKSHPLLAMIMTISMLSLAGIPPAVGFFSKFYLFATVLNTGTEGSVWLVAIAIVGSLISVYYYFKLIMAMYAKEGEVKPYEVNFVYKTILVLMTAAIILLGISPGMIIDKF